MADIKAGWFGTITRGGQPVQGTVTVTNYSGGAAATLYDTNHTSTLANPLTSDASGNYYFFVSPGEYVITISNGSETYTVPRWSTPAISSASSFQEDTAIGITTVNVSSGGSIQLSENSVVKVQVTAVGLSYPAPTELTIASGVITTTQNYHTVDTESDAASDDLDTITATTAGTFLYLQAANAARSVVCKDGTGNLILAGDFTLDNTEDMIHLISDGSNWIEVCRSNNGA